MNYNLKELKQATEDALKVAIENQDKFESIIRWENLQVAARRCEDSYGFVEYEVEIRRFDSMNKDLRGHIEYWLEQCGFDKISITSGW